MALYFLSGVGAKKSKGKAKGKGKTPKQPKGKKPVKKKVAKVALAPARAAFLGLVALNTAGIAKKLYLGYKKNPAAIKNFWAKFGGQWDKLAAAISKGAKTKISGIGVAPAAAAAAATPIVVAVIPLLRDLLKGTGEGDTSALESAAETGKELLAKDEGTPKGTATMPEDQDTGVVKKEDEETDGETPKWVLPVAAGAAALLLLR